MNDMCFSHENAKEVVHMRGEALEAHLIAHEAMYVNEQEGSATGSRRL
jgi:hypothetical protein